MNNYVIGVGLKGQNVVMKEFNAIKKTGEKLAKKKINVNIGAKVSAAGAAAAGAAASKSATPQFDTKRYVDQAKSAGQKASSALQTGFSGGLSGIANTLPGVGNIFAAAEGSIQQASQMFVQGVTASKNKQLVTANFQRAFGDAMTGAFRGTAFEFGSTGNANRATQATFATLAEQGVSPSLLAKKENIDILSKTMQAQGVSTLDELFARVQSGQLKEGGGLGKGEIEYAKSLGSLLNNRYSANVGAEGLLQLFKSKGGAISTVAGSGGLPGLASKANKEQEIRDKEENFSALAAKYEGSYNAGYANRVADLADTMKFQRLAIGVSKVKRGAMEVMAEAYDDLASGISAGKQGPQILLEKGLKKLGVNLPGTEDAASQGGAIQTGDSDDSYGSGPGPMSSANSDLTRAGAALADTLNKINSQLMAVQYQMRTRGA